MSDSTMWFVLAGVLVAFELVTGTFYLLMLGLGAAAGAFAAMAGYDLTGQLIAASLVGVLGVIVLRQLRRAKTIIEEQVGQLDLGAQVHVDAWDANGTSQVKHRGAVWTAQLAPGQAPLEGSYRIESMKGNTLVLVKI